MSRRRLAIRIALAGAGVLVLALVRRADRLFAVDPVEQAIRAVAEKGGKVERDENARGRPVKVVRLARVHITDADLQVLEAFPELRAVQLVGTSVTDDGLKHLGHLHGLRTLDLRGTPITDTGLREVRNFPELQELILLNTQVRGDGLRELAALPSLRLLELPKTCATVRAYQALRDLGLLRFFPYAQDKDGRPASRHEDVYSLDLQGLPGAADGLPGLARELTSLRALKVEAGELTNDFLFALRDLGLLRTLSPYGGGPFGTDSIRPVLTRPDDPDDMVAPARDEDARFLSFFGCRAVSDEGLAALSGLKKLQGLDLYGTAVTARGLPAIAHLLNLEELILPGFRLTAADLKLFKTQANLTFPGSRFELTDAGLKELRAADMLRRLLSKTAPDSFPWVALELGSQPPGPIELSQMRRAFVRPSDHQEWTLDLTDVRLTDAGLQELKGLDSITELVLEGTGATDAGLTNLIAHRRLKCLFLARTKVTGVGLKHLSELPELELLDLSRTGVSDAGLQNLGGLASLRVLLLDNTQVTDAGLEDLAKLPDLKVLDLSNNPMGDAGLSRLSGSEQLRILVLNGTAVTDAGIRKFKAAVPKCYVVRQTATEVPD